MSNKVVTRRYGLPFTGLCTTVPAHEAPLGSMTSASRDTLLRPGARPEGNKLARRQGSQSLGANTGLLERPVADATMRSMEVFRCASPSLTDGYPTYGILWSDEDKRFGQIYLRDTNGPQDYTLLENFSTTHYPVAAGTVGTLKMPPLPYDGNGATGYTRGAYEENRRRVGAGTRRRRGMRGKEHLPSYQGCPFTWNRRYNRATGSGSEIMRLHPAGRMPPLWAPTFPTASFPTATTSVRPWLEGDVFFNSCMYEYEDGAFGPPFTPRDITATLTSGFGLVTIPSTTASTDYYATIPWRNIPVPPPGVVRVWLLRTPKVSATSYAAGSRPDISDLRICGYVPAGRTSYDDPNGNDLALVDDPNIVRFDHKWPERARYAWTFDQRMAYGYLRPNPCAIILAPCGSAADYDVNQTDEANPGSVFFHFRLDPTNLYLKKTSGGATATQTIALSGLSLQQLVDTINATTAASTGGQWRAAVVPGCSGSNPATDLAYTSQDIVCATTNGSATVTSAALFAQVPEGCKVYGTGIPAGAYVKSRASSSSLTLSANATATGAPTLTFACDTGDDSIVTDSTYGNIRCYAASYYGVLALKQTALDALNGDAPQDFTFTAGGTTHARSAPESFYTSIGNRRSALFGDEAGVLMGGAALPDGCVVFYSRHIYMLKNLRAGSTGEDADYQLYVLELGRGCISPYSIVEGNGWVGCLTGDGFWVFDGKASAIISGDVLDRDHDGGYIGEWSYEAGLCAAAAETNTNGARFHAHWTNGRLWVNYRVSASANGYLCMDCTPSVEASGLAQLMRSEGEPYGWSSRLRYSWRASTNSISGALGSVRTSSGIVLVGCDDLNDKTYCGLAQQFEAAGLWDDGGAYVKPTAWLVMDLCGWLKFKSLRAARILYYLSDPSDELTAVVYPCIRGSTANTYSRTLTKTTGGVPFSRKEIPFDRGASAPTDTIQFFVGITAATGPGGDFEVSAIEADVELLETSL